MSDMKQIEKQTIEEMADEVYEILMLEAECSLSGMDCAIIADLLVNKKGYCKQRVGEWETIPDCSNALITYRHICRVCGYFYKDTRPNGHEYCPNCGAKMKGGAI